MLAGRCVIVTGAGRGIGAATALLLARQGGRIVVNDLDLGQAEQTVNEIKASGGDAVAFAGSVVDAGFPDALVATCVKAYGVPDVLVNNAGFLWDGMLHKMTGALKPEPESYA
jgi:3-oxoacyl-[acyl-carrier protein] reductase